MKTVNVIGTMAMAVLMGAMRAGGAEGAVLSLVPSTLTLSVGDPVDLDLVVSELGSGEAVGGVAIRLTADAAILDGVTFVIDPDDKMGAEFDFGSTFGPSFVDLVFLAEDFFPLDQFATLKGLQGTGFRLATISLVAIGTGTAPIEFVDLFGGYLSDADGIDTLPVTETRSALVTVPEPGLLALVGVGLATITARRRVAPGSGGPFRQR